MSPGRGRGRGAGREGTPLAWGEAREGRSQVFRGRARGPDGPVAWERCPEAGRLDGTGFRLRWGRSGARLGARKGALGLGDRDAGPRGPLERSDRAREGRGGGPCWAGGTPPSEAPGPEPRHAPSRP